MLGSHNEVLMHYLGLIRQSSEHILDFRQHEVIPGLLEVYTSSTAKSVVFTEVYLPAAIYTWFVHTKDQTMVPCPYEVGQVFNVGIFTAQEFGVAHGTFVIFLHEMAQNNIKALAR